MPGSPRVNVRASFSKILGADGEVVLTLENQPLTLEGEELSMGADA